MLFNWWSTHNGHQQVLVASAFSNQTHSLAFCFLIQNTALCMVLTIKATGRIMAQGRKFLPYKGWAWVLSQEPMEKCQAEWHCKMSNRGNTGPTGFHVVLFLWVDSHLCLLSHLCQGDDGLSLTQPLFKTFSSCMPLVPKDYGSHFHIWFFNHFF